MFQLWEAYLSQSFLFQGGAYILMKRMWGRAAATQESTYHGAWSNMGLLLQVINILASRRHKQIRSAKILDLLFWILILPSWLQSDRILWNRSCCWWWKSCSIWRSWSTCMHLMFHLRIHLFYLISWALVLIPLKHCNVMLVEVHVTLEIDF